MEIVALLAAGVILSSALWLPIRPRTVRAEPRPEIGARENEIEVFSMKELQKDVEVLSKS